MLRLGMSSLEATGVPNDRLSPSAGMVPPDQLAAVLHVPPEEGPTQVLAAALAWSGSSTATSSPPTMPAATDAIRPRREFLTI
jgi:hypothetical protein